MTKRRNPYGKLDADELEELIECYFNCSLSEDDEMSLRKIISATRIDTPAVREAKAVMGFASAARRADMPASTSRSRKPNIKTRLRYIAAVAAILLAGTGLYLSQLSSDRQGQEECVAYVNGQRIDNKEAIMQMMKVDLLTMQTGADNVIDKIDSDFSAIREALGELN